MSAVVIDTSAWIDFLAGYELPTLEEALVNGVAVLPPIVIAELHSGAKRRSDRDHVRDMLADLDLCDTPFDHWIRVGDLRRTLSARGLSVSTPDAHVAQCAIDLRGLLVSRDGVFSRIATILPLDVATA